MNPPKHFKGRIIKHKEKRYKFDTRYLLGKEIFLVSIFLISILFSSVFI